MKKPINPEPVWSLAEQEDLGLIPPICICGPNVIGGNCKLALYTDYLCHHTSVEIKKLKLALLPGVIAGLNNNNLGQKENVLIQKNA